MSRFTFRLPDVGEGTAEAEIVAWHVAVGDVVEEDQPLVDVMTDKATVEITSPVSGRVVARRGEPGEMFAVGGPLVEFETEASAPAADPAVVSNPSGQRNVEARETPPTTPESERPATPPPSASPPPSPLRRGGEEMLTSPPPFTGEGDQAKPGEGGSTAPAFFKSAPERPLTSPAIRRRAREAAVDLGAVQGTGPDGRITREGLRRPPRPARQDARTPVRR